MTTQKQRILAGLCACGLRWGHTGKHIPELDAERCNYCEKERTAILNFTKRSGDLVKIQACDDHFDLGRLKQESIAMVDNFYYPSVFSLPSFEKPSDINHRYHPLPNILIGVATGIIICSLITLFIELNV